MAEQKEKTPVTEVTMEDGRVLGFAGKRKLIKEVLEDSMSVRFNFANGAVRTFSVPDSLAPRLALHGAAQKIGDETAGVQEVEDMVEAVDDIMSRLSKGEWGITRAAGDSFAGASVVVRAICEATGKSVETVKAFLAKKLESTPGLTRKALYDSFRNPATQTGQIIKRLEEEKLAKTSAVDADAALAELG